MRGGNLCSGSDVSIKNLFGWEGVVLMSHDILSIYIFAMELNAMCSVAETVDTIIEHHCTTITHSTTIITNAEAQVHSKG